MNESRKVGVGCDVRTVCEARRCEGGVVPQKCSLGQNLKQELRWRKEEG